MLLWCVQEVAEIDHEEDIIRHTATDTQLTTAAAGVSGDVSRTLSEYNRKSCSVLNSFYSQLRMTCVMCWL